RVGEHGNYFRETTKRIGIAVRENERKRIRPFAAFMDKVDADIIYLSFEMGELIEDGFVLAPVIGLAPIGDKFLEVVEIGACLPICVLHLIRPPRVLQSLLQIT